MIFNLSATLKLQDTFATASSSPISMWSNDLNTLRSNPISNPLWLPWLSSELSTTKDGYLSALSAEILDPALKPLDAYLLPHVVDSVGRENWPGLIGGIQGLDGLDKEDLDYQKLDDSTPRRQYKGYLAVALEQSDSPETR